MMGETCNATEVNRDILSSWIQLKAAQLMRQLFPLQTDRNQR